MNRTIATGLSSFLLALTLLAVVALVAVLRLAPASSAPGDDEADRVFGQGGSFTSGTCNLGGISASSLCTLAGGHGGAVAVDGAGNLYVADTTNNRVLEYDSPLTTDTVADRVFGQAGSFTSNTCNLGGISAASLCTPCFPCGGVALDSSGNLYISDAGNGRVLEYDSPLTTDTVADRVFGQPDFTSGSTTCAPPSASTLCFPLSGVALDGAGNLYVSDVGNNRVLEYDSPLNTDTVADRVLGQEGSFTTKLCNLGSPSVTPSASSLCQPVGVVLNGAGNLYIADASNHRVLEYDNPLTSDTVADRVVGQGGSFTERTCNLGGISAGSLCAPRAVALDGGGSLYVADNGNHRLLEYDSPLTTDAVADRVFGKGGSFTTNTCNTAGTGSPPSASSLCRPSGVALDSAGNLYVFDGENSRVLEYDNPLAPTPTPTITLTPTITPTPTVTPTPCPECTATPTATATPTTPTVTPSGTPSSFTGETLILTPRGLQRIDSLRVGSTLLSYDHETGRLVQSRISTLPTRLVDSYLNVKTSDGTQIRTTQEHPFYDPGGGSYRPIKLFSPGDRLSRPSADGLSEVTIASIESVTERVTVYNLHVDNENHNYVAAGLLVHNKLPTPTFTPTRTGTAAPTAIATATPTPAATATATPCPAGAGRHDAKVYKLEVPGDVHIFAGPVTRTVKFRVKNEGQHTDCIRGTIDVIPPGGIGDPFGCAPSGRIFDMTFTLAKDERSPEFVLPITFDCADSAGAHHQKYIFIGIADHAADDAADCGFGASQGLGCYNALADDDDDDSDNRKIKNRPEVKND